MNPKAKILTGIAGEYFVAGELSRRGYTACITLRNTPHIDVLASDGKRAVNIQVKTRCIERSSGWDLGNKPLEYENVKNNIFYVLVAISSDEEKREIVYYIIQKKKLNKLVERNFQDHLKTPRNNGQPRITKRRIFRMNYHPKFQVAKYKDRWNILFD